MRHFSHLGWIRSRAFCTLFLVTLAVLAIMQRTQQGSHEGNAASSLEYDQATRPHQHLAKDLLSRLHRWDLWRSHDSEASQSKSAVRLPRVAIADRAVFGHDEVLGPLLYTLSAMMGIRPTLYRDTFREGFKWLNAPHFDGPFLISKDMYNTSTLNDVDIMILATGDRDLPYFIDHPEIIDAHPHLRIIAVCHHAGHWKPLLRRDKKHDTVYTRTNALAATSRWHAAGRLSYLTLSPHVSQTLSNLFTRLNVTSGDLPRVETYLPIMPLRRREPRSARKELTQVVLQGALHTRSRAYNRVFNDFVRELNTSSKLYGYSKPVDGHYRPWRSDAVQLHLVGAYVKKVETFITVPPVIKNLVSYHTDLAYHQYYGKIGETDLLLPAFAHGNEYLTVKASSSIPAAIMSRTPMLLSAKEVDAYSYVQGPALIRRRAHENEFQTITRLKSTKMDRHVWSSDAAWQAYENQLLEQNKDVLSSIFDAR